MATKDSGAEDLLILDDVETSVEETSNWEVLESDSLDISDDIIDFDSLTSDEKKSDDKAEKSEENSLEIKEENKKEDEAIDLTSDLVDSNISDSLEVEEETFDLDTVTANYVSQLEKRKTQIWDAVKKKDSSISDLEKQISELKNKITDFKTEIKNFESEKEEIDSKISLVSSWIKVDHNKSRKKA
jgi:chromosome segregation ATPase